MATMVLLKWWKPTVHKGLRLSKERYLSGDRRAVGKQNCRLKKPLPSTCPFCNSWNVLLLQNCFFKSHLLYFCLYLQSSQGFSSFLYNFFSYIAIPSICLPFLPNVDFLYCSCLLSSFHFTSSSPYSLNFFSLFLILLPPSLICCGFNHYLGPLNHPVTDIFSLKGKGFVTVEN